MRGERFKRGLRLVHIWNELPEKAKDKVRNFEDYASNEDKWPTMPTWLAWTSFPCCMALRNNYFLNTPEPVRLFSLNSLGPHIPTIV